MSAANEVGRVKGDQGSGVMTKRSEKCKTTVLLYLIRSVSYKVQCTGELNVSFLFLSLLPYPSPMSIYTRAVASIYRATRDFRRASTLPCSWDDRYFAIVEMALSYMRAYAYSTQIIVTLRQRSSWAGRYLCLYIH